MVIFDKTNYINDNGIGEHCQSDAVGKDG